MKRKAITFSVFRHPEIEGVLSRRMAQRARRGPGDPWCLSRVALRVVTRYEAVCEHAMREISRAERKLVRDAVCAVPSEIPPPMIVLLDRWIVVANEQWGRSAVPREALEGLATKIARLSYAGKVAVLDEAERGVELLIPMRLGRVPQAPPLNLYRHEALVEATKRRSAGTGQSASLILRRIVTRYEEICRQERPELSRAEWAELEKALGGKPYDPAGEIVALDTWLAQRGGRKSRLVGKVRRLSFAQRVAALDEAERALAGGRGKR